jgi:hypothetical protein
MSANYVLLEKVTVGASVSSVTFNNIPQTGYTDLVVKMSVRNSNASNSAQVFTSVNGSAGSSRVLRGSGSAASSFTDGTLIETARASAASSTSNTFSNIELYFPNYASAIAHSISSDGVSEDNSSTAYAELAAGLTTSTAAITSLTFDCGGSGNFVQYSTFYLYGIAAVGTTPTVAPYAAGGDIIQTDGTYWYHAFLSSGTFTPAKSLSCDVLVVAGGGSAGVFSGGGGAGGLQLLTSQTIPATVQNVTVGAGGAQRSGTSPGNSGIDSQFGSLTASVGGGGGGGNGTSKAALSGGSGGGGANNTPTTGGSGTTSQGYAGGNGDNLGGNGGGGGGAGAVGGTASGSLSGGIGATSATINAMASVTGTGDNQSGTYYFAGGGGGGGNSIGNGGYGGGGRAAAGATNTGGGGGSHNGPGIGYAGGSGIVIVRYLA